TLPDKTHDRQLCHVRMMFELRPHHIPCIQLKNNLSFIPTEYVTSSNGEMVDMWVSSVDFDLICQQYRITAIDFIDGFKFKSCTGVFDNYINHFMEIKKREKGAKRQEAKLFLNNLYGKLATNPRRKSKAAYFDETDNIVKYRLKPEEIKQPMYIPMGVFITAHARYMTIT